MIHLIQRGIDHLAHTLQGQDVAFLEEVRRISKELKDANYFVVANHWHDGEGSDTHLATAFAVNSRIMVGIVAEHYPPGAYAFAGQSRARFQEGANLRRGRSSTGTTDDVVAITEYDSSAGSPRNVLCPVSEQLQSGLQIATCPSRQRLTAIFPWKTQLVLGRLPIRVLHGGAALSYRRSRLRTCVHEGIAVHGRFWRHWFLRVVLRSVARQRRRCQEKRYAEGSRPKVTLY